MGSQSKGTAEQKENTVNIRFGKIGAVFENGLFGVNTEITRKGFFGGLSAQMLNNRKLYAAGAESGGPAGWEIDAEEWKYVTDRREESLCHSNFVILKNGSLRQKSDTIAFQPGHEYEAKVWIKTLSEETDVCFGSGELWLEFAVLADEHPYRELTIRFTADPPRSGDHSGRGCQPGEFFVTVKGEAAVFEMSLMSVDNYYGMRRDVIEALKYIAPGSVRFPGGCAADHFDWHQSLLPAELRIPAYGGDKWFLFPDTYNQDCLDIGLCEFVMLCRELGAEPEFSVSLLLSDGEDARRLVEFCNGGVNTEYGAKRQALGFGPFGIRLWFVGNEVYFFGREYMHDGALAARRTNEIIRGMREADPDIIPVPGLTWAEAFKPWNHAFVAALDQPYEYVSYHNYIGILPDATQGENGMATCGMLETNFADGSDIGLDFYRNELYAGMFDNVQVCADEWNYTWGKPSSNALFFSNALQFHFLARSSEKYHVRRAEFFMPVNEGMIAVDGTDCRVESTGELFRLMQGHKGGSIVDVTCDAAAPDVLCTAHGDKLFLSAVNRFAPPVRICAEGFRTEDCVLIRTGEYSFTCNDFELVRGPAEPVVPGHSVIFMTLRREA